ncbi:MAG: DUF448 domain-containing protein [Actinobacteria bacterium]|nr:MAG: DUF448 domain-containing protein [Actinomycetota bacterium]
MQPPASRSGNRPKAAPKFRPWSTRRWGRVAKADPIRTCVACRRAGFARELVRITRTLDGRLVIGGPSRGRGAWVGPGPACADSAVAALRKVFGSSIATEWGAAWGASQGGRQGASGVIPAWCPRTATRTTSYDPAESCEDT